MAVKRSPTALSREKWTNDGYIVDKVEQRIPRCFITKDLYNFADLVAMHEEKNGLVAIQSTSRSNISARRIKIIANEKALCWLSQVGRIVVEGWSYEDGQPVLKQVEIKPEDFRN